MTRNRISKDMKESYIREYKDYTRESVMKAINAVTRKYGVLDPITIHHYIISKRFGGLGYGKLKVRMDLRRAR